MTSLKMLTRTELEDYLLDPEGVRHLIDKKRRAAGQLEAGRSCPITSRIGPFSDGAGVCQLVASKRG